MKPSDQVLAETVAAAVLPEIMANPGKYLDPARLNEMLKPVYYFEQQVAMAFNIAEVFIKERDKRFPQQEGGEHGAS